MFIPSPALQAGYNVYLDVSQEARMEVGLLLLNPGDTFDLFECEMETAILLFQGEVTFSYLNEVKTAKRLSTFEEEAYCLLLAKETKVNITAQAQSELYIQKTINSNAYDPVFFTPAHVHIQKAGNNGELMGCMRRNIKTIFDYDNAPFSNMVLGEVLNFPGKWSSYPPHHHPQPEVYFHRFDKPCGFGVSFANGQVYTSTHNSLTMITSQFHSQCAAPGYAMCYAWGIRHLEGDPWLKTRIDDPEHQWLWRPDANEHIWQEK